METEQTEKEAIRAASAEVSREFKTLINADDLDSLKQSQHLMYISLSLSLSLSHSLSRIDNIMFFYYNKNKDFVPIH